MFEKGQSGNPAGRPKGIPDRRTALRAHLDPHAEGLIAKAVEMALAGDIGALRLCIERIVPPVKAKEDPVHLGDLPQRLSAKGEAVLAAMAEAKLSPDQAAVLLQALSAQARIVEIDELEKRVSALEEKRNA